MPSYPVGDVLRMLVPSRWGWVRWILDRVKGISITKGDTTIVLDERPSTTTLPPKGTGLDSMHQPGPDLTRRR